MDETLKIGNEEERHIEKPLYCLFARGGRTFYIPVENLREVIEYRDLFPVPLSPEYVKGAFPLRGLVIPVIDLAEIYKDEGIKQPDTIIIVNALKESIGFLSEGLPGFVGSGVDIREEYVIDIAKFFDTYMVKETH